ncbi:MAG TPA: RNA-binding cell elongation regulator Jag/EloR [Ilumatobacter sp.]|nr:RNA-binding cell elongation regulator Jag/EloR [Ilumatobacter sp.]
MEWVETTAKTVEAAKDLALDRLGVAADEAEFDIVDEPRSGLFGRVRGEARVRARVRPTAVRPKQDRRRDRKGGKGKGKDDAVRGTAADVSDEAAEVGTDDTVDSSAVAIESRPARSGRRGGSGNGDRPNGRPERNDRRTSNGNGESRPKQHKENNVDETTVSPEQVGEAAVAFMSGLADAFGATSTTSLAIEGDELDVRVTGADLGVLVGPGGRTLTAIQDLVRVAAQRRLGDHETRLRIDVAGYREKRKGALEQFAQSVAAQVVASGQAKALEPMSSADRKIVHDMVGEIEGVVSHSDGEDPARRVVIAPA